MTSKIERLSLCIGEIVDIVLFTPIELPRLPKFLCIVAQIVLVGLSALLFNWINPKYSVEFFMLMFLVGFHISKENGKN